MNYYMPLVLAQSDPWTKDFFGLEQDARFVVILVAIGCSTALLIVLGCLLSGVISSAASA